MNCRFCNAKLNHVFADLGKSPLANSYLNQKDLEKGELFYPLRVFVCSKCFLVQLEEFESPNEIFREYAYMSSYSKTWLNHVKEYVNEVIEKFGISKNNQVIEIASNDGYLLQFFQRKKIPVLGVEPAINVAKIAKRNKIPTMTKFFGEKTAKEIIKKNSKADLLIAFNVLPHVPNLNDFILGLKKLLSNQGIITIQFSAYLLQLIQKNEFDTIYHEHFSYFSLNSLQKIFDFYSLTIFDVEEKDIHGGSLRLYIKHSKNKSYKINESVSKKIKQEKKFGLTKISTYTKFQEQLGYTRTKIWKFFIKTKLEGKSVVGYGAPAKATTLLNYCGIDHEFIDYTVDINPYKQGLYLPGTFIPIYSPKKISKTKPDYVIILAWNLKDEIMHQMKFIKNWNGKFVILIPEVKVIN